MCHMCGCREVAYRVPFTRRWDAARCRNCGSDILIEVRVSSEEDPYATPDEEE